MRVRKFAPRAAEVSSVRCGLGYGAVGFEKRLRCVRNCQTPSTNMTVSGIARFSHALRGKKPPLKMKFSPFYVSVDYDDRCVANVMGVGG